MVEAYCLHFVCTLVMPESFPLPSARVESEGKYWITTIYVRGLKRYDCNRNFIA